MVDSLPQVSSVLFAFLLMLERMFRKVKEINEKNLVKTQLYHSKQIMNIDSFQQWSEERGIKSNVVIKKTLYAGYGLFSSENIEKDTETTVVHIPGDTLLTSRNALKANSQFAESIYSIFSRKYENAGEIPQVIAEKNENERLVLCLFLIYSNFFEKSKVWKSYIDILPPMDFFQENHVLFQPESVAGTNLDNSVSAKLSKLKKELDEVLKLALELQHEETDKESWLMNITLDMYIWADCVFWSRVVGIGGDETVEASSSEMALIPYFDFANHSGTDANIRWQRNKHDQGIDLVTYPEKSIIKDQELFLSYGSKSNQELLFIHGFCVHDNSEPSRLTIPILPFLNPANGEYNMEKLYWLKSLGAKPTLTLVPTTKDTQQGEQLSDCGWTADSISVMYLIALDEDDEVEYAVDEDSQVVTLSLSKVKIESLKELTEAVEKLDMFKIIQLRVAYLLLEALEYHLSLNVENHDASKNTAPVWKHALMYRLEERDLLKQAINMLTAARDKLMQDEAVVAYLGDGED